MKKIQVSTVKVEKPVEVQVINVNAYLIAKAVRASIALHNAFDEGMTEEEDPMVDKDGNYVTDDNGNKMWEKVRVLNPQSIGRIAAAAAYDMAVAFLDELVAAFEGDE